MITRQQKIHCKIETLFELGYSITEIKRLCYFFFFDQVIYYYQYCEPIEKEKVVDMLDFYREFIKMETKEELLSLVQEQNEDIFDLR